MNVAVSFITVILGSVISALLSGVNKKTLLKILNTAISAVINTTAFICGLYIYARISHIPFDFSSLFPEKASVIVGIYLYLLISVVSGIVLGSIESGGIENYMKKLFHLHFFKISVAIFMIFNIVFASAGVFLTYTEDHKTLIISEICPHNFNLISDSSDNFSDYIELYNNSSYDIKLSDFYLSENFNEPDKFQLPDIDLPAGDYIIIWADGSEVSVDSSGDIHANFRLSDDETVILSKAGKVISAVKYGNLPDNVSITLYNGKYIRAFGTPLESNDTCIEYKAATLEAPQFNIQSGIYTEERRKLA